MYVNKLEPLMSLVGDSLNSVHLSNEPYFPYSLGPNQLLHERDLDIPLMRLARACS